MSVEDQIPFMLGMFSVSASPAFPAIVLDDEAVIPLNAILPLAARLGLALTGADSIFGLVENWDHNFAGLSATVMALNDNKLGRYFRSAFSALEFFEPETPIPAPRQIFTECTLGASGGTFVARLPSAVAGPKAKVPLPEAGQIVAEAKIGAVIGRPVHLATGNEARAAIAGFMTLTDITNVTAEFGQSAPDWLAAKSGPGFMPTGPWFVPAAFAGKMNDVAMAISFNGETTVKTSSADIALDFTRQVETISARCQLFPGDIIASGAPLGDWEERLLPLGDGDIIETAVFGLGRQTINPIRIARG